MFKFKIFNNLLILFIAQLCIVQLNAFSKDDNLFLYASFGASKANVEAKETVVNNGSINNISFEIGGGATFRHNKIFVEPSIGFFGSLNRNYYTYNNIFFNGNNNAFILKSSFGFDTQSISLYLSSGIAYSSLSYKVQKNNHSVYKNIFNLGFLYGIGALKRINNNVAFNIKLYKIQNLKLSDGDLLSKIKIHHFIFNFGARYYL